MCGISVTTPCTRLFLSLKYNYIIDCKFKIFVGFFLLFDLLCLFILFVCVVCLCLFMLCLFVFVFVVCLFVVMFTGSGRAGGDGREWTER